MNPKLMMTVLFAATAAFFAACGGGTNGAAGNSTAKAPVVLRKSVPAEFKDKTNPTPNAAAEGEKLFKAQCISCHGEKADGDSAIGKALKPPAANLTTAEFQNGVNDDYIFWRITVGGAGGPEGSGMTPFKDTLNEEQRWQVVAFVRSLKK